MTIKENDTLQSPWDRIKVHLSVNRELLPLKAVMFLFYGAFTAVLLPYITLHMLQIGVTIEEVGIIYAVLPFASCLGPPVAGMIADKIGNYKIVLMASIFATAVFHTLLLTIDAHGANPTKMVANSSELPANTIAYLTCDHAREIFLEVPKNCANDTCPYGNLLLTDQPMIRLITSECTQSCNGKTNNTNSCLMTSDATDCYSFLDDDVLLQLELQNQSTTKINPDFCLFRINQLLLSNSTQTTLDCDCPIQCPLRISQTWSSTCSTNNDTYSSSKLDEYDYAKHRTGFWLYLFIRILATATLGTSFTMLDATTICLIKKYKGQLGRQRLFGVLGSATFAMLTGILLDWAANLKNGFRDYATVFYFTDALLVVVLVLLLFVEVSVEKSEGSLVRNTFKVLRLIHIDIFMVLMLLLGIFWGFLEAFLFIFLIELKASSYLLGFTVTLGALVGVPFLYVSHMIVKKIGKLVVLISAFFIYSVRFIGYSFITDPWMSLPFEALEAVTIHLMGVSCSMFCAQCAPPGLLATLQGLAGSCHYSIGRGTGSFIGGILIAMHGTRITFRIFGLAAGVCGVLYAILYCTYMRKNDKFQTRKPPVTEREEKNPEVVFHALEQADPQDDEDTINRIC
ncbi:major facilitator superfamily domain-containing protein 6 [Daphnia magna]|uniref:Solute carrier family 2, facilitated glucose transporter member n=2 Tax=Daphnia magna TaxID=35525 RepID=A0A0P6JSN7_9CRUS|nr:major facilitator superfamily domain-containing protein 6 [Daphnia magna]KAK4009736.1 hypothetical protein OUZ56_018882 [Daphnia magna]KZS19902.1 Uncharacterized protein APZ42_013699 [Daphnia magna]